MPAPRQLVLPDSVAGDVWGVALLEHFLERAEVRIVEPIIIERDGPLADLLVVVDVLADIEIDLVVIRADRDELAADRAHDLVKDALECSAYEHCFALWYAYRQEAEIVTKLLNGRPDWEMDVTGAKSMHGQPINDTQGDGPIFRSGKCTLD
jgi:hypothetical protein